MRVRVRIDSEGYFYGRHKAHQQTDRKIYEGGVSFFCNLCPNAYMKGQIQKEVNVWKNYKGCFSGGNSELADAFNRHSGLNVNPKSLKQMMNRWRLPLQEQGVTFRSYRSNTQRLVDVEYIPSVTKETQVTQRSGP